MPNYLLVCSTGTSLTPFRASELKSISVLLDLDLTFHPEYPLVSESAFTVVSLKSDEDAVRLASRSISIRRLYRLWAASTSYAGLKEALFQPAAREQWAHLAADPGCSFKFALDYINHSLTSTMQRSLVEAFDYMQFTGKVSLKAPMLEVGVAAQIPKQTAVEVDGPVEHVFVGKKLANGRRDLVDFFDVKKRAHIGNTTMEAEASLYMANQALCAPGKLAYDPFAGTGSMLLTAAYWGAYAYGSDIDPRPLQGRGTTNVYSSAEQYNIRHRIVDLCTWDFTQHPFRVGGFMDAIITDPPYGVRAGAKRLGRKEDARERPPVQIMVDGSRVPGGTAGEQMQVWAHELPDYIPPTRPLMLQPLVLNLYTYSRFLLKVGGRLVFFMPSENTGEFESADLPEMRGMKVIADDVQDFNGRWGRRLVTVEKTEDVEEDGVERGVLRGPTRPPTEEEKKQDFRERYYSKFVPQEVI